MSFNSHMRGGTLALIISFCLSIAWAMARPGITCMLVGTRNISQLEENARAASISLSPEIIKRLDDLTEPLLKKLGSNPDYYQGGERKRIH